MTDIIGLAHEIWAMSQHTLAIEDTGDLIEAKLLEFADAIRQEQIESQQAEIERLKSKVVCLEIWKTEVMMYLEGRDPDIAYDISLWK